MSKRIVICGQSNERGHREVLAANKGEPMESLYGIPCRDPIQPKGSAVAGEGGEYYGSMWPKLSEMLAKRGVFCSFANCAVGATHIIGSWCGDDSGANDGTGAPKDKDAAGWDPNSYFSDALAAVNEGNFDERWAFLEWGNADASNNASLANYQAAHENAVEYFLANSVNVAIGLTCTTSAMATWSENNGSPAIVAAVATYADNSSVIAGANLHTALGSGIKTTDGSHWDQRTYDLATSVWYNALVAAGW